MGNVALDNGGGIYALRNITLDGATLGTTTQPNSAGVDGGGLYTAAGNFYIQEESLVEGNTAGSQWRRRLGHGTRRCGE